MHSTWICLMISLSLLPVSSGFVTKQIDWTLHRGTITGQVLDADGKPVMHAQIIATTEGSGPVPSTLADEEGRFKLEYVKINKTYHLMASKMEEGYLYTCGLVLDCPSTGTCPKVTLTSNKVRADAIIRLGPRGGALSGVVRDAITNKPIAEAVIIFYGKSVVGQPSSREVRSDVQGNFSSGALPLCPIRMKVDASGYHTWYFNEAVSAKAAEDVVVESGETKKMSVSLIPNR